MQIFNWAVNFTSSLLVAIISSLFVTYIQSSQLKYSTDQGLSYMFKNLKRGNYYAVPKAITRLRQKYIDQGYRNSFDSVFDFYYNDFYKRYQKNNDEKALQALNQMIHLEVDNYLMLACTVLYVDVAPKGSNINESTELIGESGMKDMYDTFLELGLHESEVNFKKCLLSTKLINELKQLQGNH